MKLVDLIGNLNNVDEDLIIFQENKADFNSDIILASAQEGDEGKKVENGKEYFYLLEVFLAKEFVEDWVNSLSYKPTNEEIARRLHAYAIYDA